MSRASALFVVGIVTFGCAEKTIAFRNTPPSVEITLPVDGELFDFGEPIGFEALVDDVQNEANDLGILWESSIDGPLDDDAADSAGLVLFDSSILTSGLHTISLQVTDLNEESATASIEISVGGRSPGMENAPRIIIEGPIDGETYQQSDLVTVIAQIQDDEQPWDTLTVNILSSRDGGLWTGNPDESGMVQVDTDALSAGTHTITVNAVDEDDNQTSESVEIEVVADERPGINIITPSAGDWFWITDPIRFEAEVNDDFSDPSDLLVEWSSDLDGVFGILPPSSTGQTVVDTTLFSIGYHLISLSVADPDGNVRTESVNIEVRDPLAHDGDLDGYSELEGDCDDADPYTSPDSEEICDEKDNDCDEEINEDFLDDFEPSDTKTEAYDLGEIDDGVILGILGGDASGTSVGLTLHEPEDEDWLYFDGGDDSVFDNVNVRVEVGPFPSSGSYVVELYLDDGIVDTAIGGGLLSVEFEGSIFDGGEDDFWIRIYSDEWSASDCEERFEVKVIDR